MMRYLAVFLGHETVNEPDQRLAIESAEQHTAGCLNGDEVRERHDVEIGDAPNFLLQFLDGAQFREGLDRANGNI